jgi:aldehyde dehydrogenase (NAD+)
MNMNAKIRTAKGIFVNNKWRSSNSGKEIPVLAPATGEVVGAIAAGNARDIDVAIEAARYAFEQGAWGRLTATERGRLITKLSRLVEDNAEELAMLEATDTGKPMKQARADVTAVARYFEFYGAAADKVRGETIPFVDGYIAMTVYEALGVTGHIIPWNYPGQMFGRSVTPALAMGNAVVVKPAEEACLVPLRLAELAAEAGFPDGAINVVPGIGEEAGAALSGHPGIDFLSFTGSPEVGTLVQTAAAKNHIACTLELGGKSPQIIFADADMDAALASVVGASVQNAGQTCSAGSRVLVDRKIWNVFLENLKSRFDKLQAGTPEMDLDLGPVISSGQKMRVEGMLSRAEAAGSHILARGKIAKDAPKGGFYIPPVVLQDVERDSEMALQEVFGPVLTALPFDDEADAIKLANGTDFGLTAGVWSADGSRALRIAKKVRVGQMYINGYGSGGGVELPFGGRKKSGHGREKGMDALYEMSALKTIVVNHG